MKAKRENRGQSKSLRGAHNEVVSLKEGNGKHTYSLTSTSSEQFFLSVDYKTAAVDRLPPEG